MQIVSEADRICSHEFVADGKDGIHRAMGAGEKEKECTTGCKRYSKGHPMHDDDDSLFYSPNVTSTSAG